MSYALVLLLLNIVSTSICRLRCSSSFLLRSWHIECHVSVLCICVMGCLCSYRGFRVWDSDEIGTIAHWVWYVSLWSMQERHQLL